VFADDGVRGEVVDTSCLGLIPDERALLARIDQANAVRSDVLEENSDGKVQAIGCRPYRLVAFQWDSARAGASFRPRTGQTEQYSPSECSEHSLLKCANYGSTQWWRDSERGIQLVDIAIQRVREWFLFLQFVPFLDESLADSLPILAG
jgi:hypothetical protein